jgi:hypothetical protein
MSESTNKMAQAAGIYDKMTPGQQAEVRRGALSRPFWEIVHHVEGSAVTDATAKKWQALCRVIATADFASEPSFGRALSEAGLSEQRFAKLLEAREEQLPRLLRSAAQQLAAAGQPANLQGAYWLLFSSSESTRIRIAQDFFQTNSDDE